MRLSVRRDQAGLLHQAGELAQRVGDVLHAQRPGQNARRQQNRQGIGVIYQLNRNMPFCRTGLNTPAVVLRRENNALCYRVTVTTLKCFITVYHSDLVHDYGICLFIICRSTLHELSVYSYP